MKGFDYGLWRGTRTDIAFRLWREWVVAREGIVLWAARQLPYNLRYWATIVSCAEATTGEYGDTVVPELGMMEMLQRIGAKRPGAQAG